MRIGIGSDHVGYDLKLELIQYIEQLGHTTIDYGHEGHERTSYVIYAERVAKAVVAGDVDLGILVCGTGIGMSIAANKVAGIRAAVCSEPYSAVLSRNHNNANILAIGARVTGSELAKMIVDMWIKAPFEGNRHQERVEQISEIERCQPYQG